MERRSLPSQVELRVGFMEHPARRNQLTPEEERALGHTQHTGCTEASTNPGTHRLAMGQGQEKEANGNLEECRGRYMCAILRSPLELPREVRKDLAFLLSRRGAEAGERKDNYISLSSYFYSALD